MRVSLTVDHGYLIAHLGGLRALVDTGSPVSFGDATNLVLDGVEHTLSPQLHSIDELRQQAGAAFDVLLGTDVLARHRFTLDTPRGELSFGEPADGAFVEQAGLIMGSPYLGIGVCGQEVPCILDTGSSISLLPSTTRWPGPPTGHRRDFVPGLGPFETPVRRCSARVLGQELDLEFGALPRSMEQLLLCLAPARGLLGMEILQHGRLTFDLGRALVAFEPHAGNTRNSGGKR